MTCHKSKLPLSRDVSAETISSLVPPQLSATENDFKILPRHATGFALVISQFISFDPENNKLEAVSLTFLFFECVV